MSVSEAGDVQAGESQAIPGWRCECRQLMLMGLYMYLHLVTFLPPMRMPRQLRRVEPPRRLPWRQARD